MMIARSIAVLTLVGGFALLSPLSGEADLHFALSRSAPEDGASVGSPGEVRLWFTEEPQDETTSIRLIDEAGEMVSGGEVQQETEDGRVFFIELDHPIGAGTYTVAWRAIGSDGHVVRGDFSFSVVAD